VHALRARSLPAIASNGDHRARREARGFPGLDLVERDRQMLTPTP